jgi:predicted cupin superfamily sugar epimerase
MKSIKFTEHPEGGRFAEVFRSASTVSTSRGVERTALTHIYFNLNEDEKSLFHKVTSDEVWNLYQGAGLRLYTWDGTDTPPDCITLSEENNCFCHVIPAGTWQAAEPITGNILVGCSVAPGFEFTDFTLIDPSSKECELLCLIAPELARFTIP